VKKADALNCFWNAYNVAKSQKAKMWELRTAISMAKLLYIENRRDEAREILNKTYAWFTEGFETMDLQKARSLMTSLQ